MARSMPAAAALLLLLAVSAASAQQDDAALTATTSAADSNSTLALSRPEQDCFAPAIVNVDSTYDFFPDEYRVTPAAIKAPTAGEQAKETVRCLPLSFPLLPSPPALSRSIALPRRWRIVTLRETCICPTRARPGSLSQARAAPHTTIISPGSRWSLP